MISDLTPAQAALKTATKLLISRVGGLEAASEVCRVGVSTLSYYQDMHRPAAWMPIDVVAQLEAIAQSRPVTEALARAHGCRVVDEVSASTPQIATSMAQFARASGETVGSLVAALADGRIEEAERDDVLSRVGEARRHLDAITSAVRCA